MDQRPIAVFDSGVGGLTALRELRRLLPEEQYIYLGDTARMPYGDRPPEEILTFARQNQDFLLGFDPKALVVACGTMASSAMPLMESRCSVPLIGAVEPAVREAAAATKNGVVGVIGTSSMIRRGLFRELFRALDPNLQVTAQACPKLAPLAEAGRTSPEDPELREAIETYLTPIRAAGADTLILGCTHYPLLAEAIGAFMGPDVELVDCGGAAARRTARLLAQEDALAPAGSAGGCRYFVSGDPKKFAPQAAYFMGAAPGSVQAEQVRLDDGKGAEP